MIAWLRRWWAWLWADALPPATGRTFDYTRSAWGHKIHRWDTVQLSVGESPGRWFIIGHGPAYLTSYAGHLWTGDVLLSRMESGRVGRFMVLEARYFPDPPDMFRAIVTWLGYEEAA